MYIDIYIYIYICIYVHILKITHVWYAHVWTCCIWTCAIESLWHLMMIITITRMINDNEHLELLMVQGFGSRAQGFGSRALFIQCGSRFW